MKKLLCVWAVFALGTAWSQAPVEQVSASAPEPSASAATPNYPSEEARLLERQRLDKKSDQIEDQYKQDMRICYQQFDVVSCRLKARDRRIEAKTALRKEELPFKAMERQIKTEEATQRLVERQSDAKLKQQEADRAQALLAAKERADANAQKQIDHALKGSKRAEYEEKQRLAAQHRAEVEKKQRERNKESAAPLPVPGK